MKRLLKYVFSFVLLSLSALSLCVVYLVLTSPPKLRILEFSFVTRGGGNVTGIMNCTVTGFPSEISSLNVSYSNYSDAEARALARAFNITGNLTVTRDTWTWVRGDNGVGNRLILYGTGALKATGMSPESYSPVSCDFAEAKAIADKYVSLIRNMNLISDILQINFSHADYSEYYAAGASTVPVAITVYYDAVYDGKPLLFKGDVEVTVEAEGQANQVTVFTHNVTQGQPMTVIPFEEALKSIGSYVTSENVGAIENLSINSVRLGYYCPPPGDTSDKLLPAYELTCTAINRDGSNGVEYVYLPATDFPLPLS